MKRIENCLDAKISHITFKNDSLVFQFAKSKYHHNGKENVRTWYVYVDPHKPHICPVLEIALYLFTYPELLVNKTLLFQGKSQYNEYSMIFLFLIKENLEHLKTLGVKEVNLGMQYCIKLVATMGSALYTVSPPIV